VKKTLLSLLGLSLLLASCDRSTSVERAMKDCQTNPYCIVTGFEHDNEGHLVFVATEHMTFRIKNTEVINKREF
jgi:hypothetical protein